MESISAVSAWVLASRPRTLSASICPVCIGSLLAAKTQFDVCMFFCVLLSSIFIQVGTNIANDYYDFFQGADTSLRKGPKRITQKGYFPPETVKKGFIYCFIAAFILGIYPIIKGGWSIAALGTISIILGVFYTKGKYSLSYLGIADLFVLLFFGVFATGFTFYLHTLQFSSIAFLSGLGPGCLSMSLLSLNNIRDEQEDAKAQKKTLVVRFGSFLGKKQYSLGLSIASFSLVYFSPYLCPIFLFITIYLIKKIYTKKNVNSLFTATAKMLILYTFFFFLGQFF